MNCRLAAVLSLLVAFAMCGLSHGMTAAQLAKNTSGGGIDTYGMAYRSTALDISVDTWTDVPLNGGHANLSNVSHSTTENPERVTVASTGVYKISYVLHGLRGSSRHQVARLYRNGSAEIVGSYSQCAMASTDANEVHQNAGVVIVSLTSGDYVTLQAATNQNVTNEVDFYRGDGHPPSPTTDVTAVMTVVKLE